MIPKFKRIVTTIALIFIIIGAYLLGGQWTLETKTALLALSVALLGGIPAAFVGGMALGAHGVERNFMEQMKGSDFAEAMAALKIWKELRKNAAIQKLVNDLGRAWRGERRGPEADLLATVEKGIRGFSQADAARRGSQRARSLEGIGNGILDALRAAEKDAAGPARNAEAVSGQEEGQRGEEKTGSQGQGGGAA